jgi:AcrR family transcriptional regulator
VTRRRPPKSPAITPRKLPQQARAQATYDAIVGASARLLRRHGYDAVTTNHIARQAGVSVGTLYEFFPNKEAIVAALAERQLGEMVAHVQQGLVLAFELEPRERVRFVIRRIVDHLAADRALFRVLLQTPFVQQLPVSQRATHAAFELARQASVGRAMNLPHLEADLWLITRIVYSAVLEIAFTEGLEHDRGVLTDELARLTYRMIHAADPAPA